MGKEDMTADVPGETVIIKERGGQTTHMGVALEELPVGVTQFMEMMGGAQAGGAGAEDEDFHAQISTPWA
jgi:hypothetical protein